MQFEINKKFILLKVEEKSKVNLYTLIDNESGDKVVAVGVKNNNFVMLDRVDVTLSFKTQNQKFDTKNDGVKFVETLNVFVSRISKVKDNV